MLKLTASALTLALAAGCAAEGPEPTIDLGESDDRITDFDFAPRVSEVLPLEGKKVEAVVNVADAERGDSLLVTGPLYLIDVPEGGELDVRVTTSTIVDFAWLTDDLQFMILQEGDDGAWTPMSLFVEYDREGVPTLSKLDSFDELNYDADRNILTVENGAVGEFEESEFEMPGDGQIGVFAIPASTWGNIRGDYDYKLEADCDGELCRREEAAPIEEPTEEPSEEPGEEPGEEPSEEPGEEPSGPLPNLEDQPWSDKGLSGSDMPVLR